MINAGTRTIAVSSLNHMHMLLRCRCVQHGPLYCVRGNDVSVTCTGDRRGKAGLNVAVSEAEGSRDGCRFFESIFDITIYTL